MKWLRKQDILGVPRYLYILWWLTFAFLALTLVAGIIVELGY